jgi:hypothetical protein
MQNGNGCMTHAGMRARRAAFGLAIVGIAIVALHAAAADAEIFKCKGPGGRVLYSDSPCPGGGGEILTLTEGSVIPFAKPPTADPDAETPNAPPRLRDDAPRAAGRYQPSANERQRIVDLERVQHTADNGEKREAARIEIDEIRRGVMARMSYEDRRRMDGYWVDLGNADRRRRVAAVQQLADLFAAAWR